MKTTHIKIAVALAFLAAATTSQAATITKMTIEDVVDSNVDSPEIYNPEVIPTTLVAGPDGVGQDGISGAFRFSPINLERYSGSSMFSGDLNGGSIFLSGSTAAFDNSRQAFTTGFSFAGKDFEPYNPGLIAGDVTGGTLTFSAFDWAGLYHSMDGSYYAFFPLQPDAGSFTVHNLYALSDLDGDAATNQYAYRLGFKHQILLNEDPSGGSFTGITTYWILEGVITTTPVPEPATYGMIFAGLGLVGLVTRRRNQRVVVA